MPIRPEFVPVVNGRLTQVGAPFRVTQKRVYQAVFLCSCGTRKVIRVNRVKNGVSKSCGCLHREVITKHKHTKENRLAYSAWRGMKARCLNYDPDPNYGGRGITVCDRWRHSFESFLEDMGECPDGMSIDRIDNNGNYEPGNCKWSTVKEQSHNRRTNVLITVGDKTQCISAWAEEVGIHNATISGRLKRGWSEYDAIMTPPKNR